MEILNRFIADVFDDDTIDVKQFIQKEDLNMDAIMQHPLFKLNVLFGSVWNVVFGTYPTKYDMRDYKIRNANRKQHDISSILQDIVLLRVAAIDMQALKEKIQDVAQSVSDRDYVKGHILRKWHYRFYPTFPNPDVQKVTDPLIVVYMKHIKQSKYLPRPDKDEPYYNISGNVDFHPNFEMQYGTDIERLQYMIHKDIHFCKKLITEGLIIYEDAHLNHLEVLKEATGISSCFMFEDVLHTVHFLPKIAKVFYNLTDIPLPDISPNNSVTLKDVSTGLLPHFLPKKLKVSFMKHYIAKMNNANDLMIMQFIVTYINAKLKDVVNLLLHSNDNVVLKENVVLLVDNRENPMSVLSLMVTLLNMDLSRWDVRVVTSTSALKYYLDTVGKFARVDVAEALNTDKFTIDTYNQLLMSTSFWNDKRKWKKALIVQDDGLLVRHGVESYLEYDYVGAPWIEGPGNEYLKEHVNPNMVGNGGLSLRSIQAMIDISSKYVDDKNQLFFYNIIKVPEDVYFVKAMYKEGKYNLPSTQVASTFSSEEILNVNSIGLHKCWAYHPKEKIEMYLQKILDEIVNENEE